MSDATYVYNSNADMVASGKITCATTASDLYINLGFIPTYIKLDNASSGGKVTIEWYKGMTDGHAKKTASDGTITYLTSLGVTPTTVDDTFIGVTVGLDTDLNVSGEIVYWYAIG